MNEYSSPDESGQSEKQDTQAAQRALALATPASHDFR